MYCTLRSNQYKKKKIWKLLIMSVKFIPSFWKCKIKFWTTFVLIKLTSSAIFCFPTFLNYKEARIAKGQRAKVDLTNDEIEQLIKFATNKPKELYKKIMNLRLEGKFDNLAIINDMGLKISNEVNNKYV